MPTRALLPEIEARMRCLGVTERVGRELDPDSIMLYPIPANWTTNGFSAEHNYELSQSDRALIKRQYPP